MIWNIIRRRNHFVIQHTLNPIRLYSSAPDGNTANPLTPTTAPTTDPLTTKADETLKGVLLPDLPPPVRGYPTFWINSREAEDFLYPLYRRGWGIKFYPRSIYQDPHRDRFAAHLTTDFSFPNYNCAAEFIANLNPICEAEKHHPSSFTLRNIGKHPTVTLHVQTHTALRPRWHEEDSSADPPLSRRVPGITRRDLRFSILVERLYDTYLHDGRALERRGNIVKHYFDRPEWPHLIHRFIRSSLNKDPGTGTSTLSQLAKLVNEIEPDKSEGQPGEVKRPIDDEEKIWSRF